MRRRYGRWSTLVLLLGLVGACAAPVQAPTRDASPEAPAAPPSASTAAAKPAALPPLPAPLKVRVGSGSNIADAPIYVALDRGYFTQAGVDIEDLRFAAVSSMMAPLAAGQLDVVSAVVELPSSSVRRSQPHIRCTERANVPAPHAGRAR